MSSKNQAQIEIEEDDDKVIVGTYLQENIKAKIKADAKINKRSISSQIAWIIEKHYEHKEE